MGRHDWYRNENWTAETQAEFRARFNRSRGRFHKAQYLRIQALYLAQAKLPEPAISLLNELLESYPEPSQVVAARMQLAECLQAMGRTPAAIDEYRHAMQAERESVPPKSGAWLPFAWLVFTERLDELYPEAFNVIPETLPQIALLFPIQRFKYNALCAMVAEWKSDRQSAQKYALAALKEAALDHSGFRYHATLGLVEELEETLATRLRALAAGCRQL
jgi:tetratricopeptide (TPR) repeat protein